MFNYRIRQLYPWLDINLQEGRQNLKRYPEILKKTRQIFVQKIKDFILYRSDEILVGMFVSVVQVAYYGNYTIVTSKLNFLINILSDGMNAGVGNLVAEGNDKNTMKVFWELTAIRFLIAGIIIYSILFFMQPFITCWLGPQYRLHDIIVYLLAINFFIFISRGVVELYIAAHGIFSDVWAAWTELILNISLILILAPKYGIAGILSGKILSVLFISMLWRPYFLFSHGLHKPVSVYWKGMMPYYTVFGIFGCICLIIRNYIIEPNVSSFPQLLFYGIATYPLLIVSYFIVLFTTTRGMKYFIARKPSLYTKLSKLLLSRNNHLS